MTAEPDMVRDYKTYLSAQGNCPAKYRRPGGGIVVQGFEPAPGDIRALPTLAGQQCAVRVPLDVLGHLVLWLAASAASLATGRRTSGPPVAPPWMPAPSGGVLVWGAALPARLVDQLEERSDEETGVELTPGLDAARLWLPPRPPAGNLTGRRLDEVGALALAGAKLSRRVGYARLA
jgi:hypothetical protein